jgi:hypothetical protein
LPNLQVPPGSCADVDVAMDHAASAGIGPGWYRPKTEPGHED